MTRTTTPKKSSGTTTTRRKRTVKSRIVPVESVTKYTKPTEIEKVTETPTEQKPSLVRPEKPNLTYVDYVEDAKVRWQIHSYEVNEAWQDVKRFYQWSSPQVVKAFNWSKNQVQQLSTSINNMSKTDEVETKTPTE
tara:strand:- start:63 stop:470 length:408 start_codon:yes stop_codon:yes gene_type:complete